MRYPLLLISALMASTASAFPHNPTSVVGGQSVVNIAELPWIASLQTKEEHDHFCGASFIAPNMLISAAHCFTSVDDEEILITSGRFNLTKSSQEEGGLEFEVEQVIRHPNYTLTWMGQIGELVVSRFSKNLYKVVHESL